MCQCAVYKEQTGGGNGNDNGMGRLAVIVNKMSDLCKFSLIKLNFNWYM